MNIEKDSGILNSKPRCISKAGDTIHEINIGTY